MESALTISRPTASASLSASADLPLAVGPAISQMRPVMQLVLTLVGPDGAETKAAHGRIVEALASAAAEVKPPIMLGHGAVDVPLDADDPKAAIAEALGDAP